VTENAIDSMYVVQSGMLDVFVNGMGPDNLVRTMSRGQIVSAPCLAYRVREPERGMWKQDDKSCVAHVSVSRSERVVCVCVRAREWRVCVQ
jgi:hypothetical protein